MTSTFLHSLDLVDTACEPIKLDAFHISMGGTSSNLSLHPQYRLYASQIWKAHSRRDNTGDLLLSPHRDEFHGLRIVSLNKVCYDHTGLWLAGSTD